MAVVALDCRARRYARHDGFGASGISCKIMVFNVTEADTPIRFCYHPYDIHRCPTTCYTDTNTIFRVAIYTRQFLIGTFAGQFFPFFICVLTMTSKSKHQSNIFLPDTCSIQLIKKRRHNFRRRHRPRNIACDNHNLLTRTYDLAKPRRSYRHF